MVTSGGPERRIAMGIARIVGLPAAFACLFFCSCAMAAPARQPAEPIQIAIGAGSVDTAAFRWSSAFAEILSRPPGLPKCDPGGPCGVPGVIAGARTYDDPQALLKALVDGRIATAIIPSMRIYDARCGVERGKPIAVLKALYRQPVNIVIRNDAKISTPRDFAGKTIVTGEHGSDAEAVTLALLNAYKVSPRKVKLLRLAAGPAIATLKGGGAQMGLFISHAFDGPVADLVDQGFTLLSLPDSPQRQKLLKALPVFQADAIPPGTYSGLPAISTISQTVVWAAGSGLDPAFAEELVTDLSEAHNQTHLADLVGSVAPMPEEASFLRLPAPAAEGARRFAESKTLPVSELACPEGK
jgi:TRAP-type uncharacterized transport system substrate-binding protein